MASIYKRSRDKARKNASWSIGYVDATGKQRTVKGCPDKAATEAMARKLESEVALRKRGVIDAPATTAIGAMRPGPSRLTSTTGVR